MKLKDKVQNSLDEARMLVLGVQVLLGFDLQAFFTKRLESLPQSAQLTKLVSLGLLLVALTLVLAPGARHRIVDRGRDTPHLDAFTRAVTTMALLPFAVALGLDVYVVGLFVGGGTLGVVLGGATAAAAIAAWYGFPWLLRKRHATAPSSAPEDGMETTALNDKIRHVLTEARVVLPGTQALLGFQFAAVLQAGFDPLPASSKLVHVAALLALGASVIFLMLPAAYHRIAEGGHISERLHRFSSACLLLAMATLGIAVAGDTFIVVRKATGSMNAGLAVSAGWLACSAGTWFGLMIGLRRRHRVQQEEAATAARRPQRALA